MTTPQPLTSHKGVHHAVLIPESDEMPTRATLIYRAVDGVVTVAPDTYGIAPGWYDAVQLLRAYAGNADAVRFIADMME